MAAFFAVGLTSLSRLINERACFSLVIAAIRCESELFRRFLLEMRYFISDGCPLMPVFAHDTVISLLFLLKTRYFAEKERQAIAPELVVRDKADEKATTIISQWRFIISRRHYSGVHALT